MADLADLIAAGRGDAPADLVLRGAEVLDVATGARIAGDVAISGETIVGIGEAYEGREVLDLAGLTLVPGFIDTHLHVESSLVTPQEFDRCVTPRGITTAICDPHEIANVLGVAGIEWFLKAAPTLLMDLRVMLSSCVPSTDMETSGAFIDADALAGLADDPRVLGLAEFMNYPGVMHRDPQAMDKLRAFAGRHVDGHAPQLSGRGLNAYLAAGIRTEHEATTEAEAREKLSRGARILIREGSVSKDLDALMPLMTDRLAARLALCTDDRNPLDIAEEGHLDHMIRHAIARGVDPVVAYRVASLSAAEAFGLADRGQIAPGRRADIVAVGALEACDAQAVWCAGRRVDAAAFAARPAHTPIGRRSVRLPPVSAATFRDGSADADTPVIGIRPGQILTDHLREAIDPGPEGKRPDAERDLARIAVIERHGRNGNVAAGFVRGFGMRAGAIASTVAHDHHNLVCVGMDDADMAAACARVAEIEGGFAVVRDGVVLADLALPVAGLMSLSPFEEVCDDLRALRKAARSLGIGLPEPFLQLAFLALPVIPALKITDRGMVDVEAFRLI